MEVKQFLEGLWTESVNVRSFVFNNITPYHGTAGLATKSWTFS
jgi:formate C-acetyltransferase